MTEITKLICNRCGAETTFNRYDSDRSGHAYIDWANCMSHATERRLDFCPSCWKEIKEFANLKF